MGAGFRGSGSAITSTVLYTPPASCVVATVAAPLPRDSPRSLDVATRLSHRTTGTMVSGRLPTGGILSGMVATGAACRAPPPPRCDVEVVTGLSGVRYGGMNTTLGGCTWTTAAPAVANHANPITIACTATLTAIPRPSRDRVRADSMSPMDIRPTLPGTSRQENRAYRITTPEAAALTIAARRITCW